MSGRILVAGIGNVLMQDDAIGPYCVAQLLAQYEFPEHVILADLGTPGFDLVLHLALADSVIIVDALRGAAPGEVRILEPTLGSAEVSIDTHGPALEESIQVARLASGRPRDVVLVGLGGAQYEQGAGLSVVARAALPVLMNRVLDELTARDVAWRPYPVPRTPHVWWEAATRGTSAGRPPY